MLVVPAIDLKEGHCVRLYEGRMETAHIYADDPASQARAFIDAGIERLHVVDLDGAFLGRTANLAAIKAIVDEATSRGVEVQVGGGMRDEASVERTLALGVRHAILGTIAVKDPPRFEAIAKRWPGHIIAGIDAKNGDVAIDGWANASGKKALDVAKRVEEMGASAIIYTDIARDGTQKGVNIEATDALARLVSIPVFASGGVGSIADLEGLRGTRAAGVIIGRALYERTIDLGEALELARSE
jgi:phosphoribosylformimino-5-aminoimidazole carboxamide ribotide isomerase